MLASSWKVVWESEYGLQIPYWLLLLNSQDTQEVKKGYNKLDASIIREDVFEGYITIEEILATNDIKNIVPYLIYIFNEQVDSHKYYPLRLLSTVVSYDNLTLPTTMLKSTTLQLKIYICSELRLSRSAIENQARLKDLWTHFTKTCR